MGWERGGYYTRSRKVNGRVVREYVGGGAAGRQAAAEDARRRQDRAAEREAQAALRAELEAVVAALRELDEFADLAAHAALYAAGFYRHRRGEWRRRGCPTSP